MAPRGRLRRRSVCECLRQVFMFCVTIRLSACTAHTPLVMVDFALSSAWMAGYRGLHRHGITDFSWIARTDTERQWNWTTDHCLSFTSPLADTPLKMHAPTAFARFAFACAQIMQESICCRLPTESKERTNTAIDAPTNSPMNQSRTINPPPIPIRLHRCDAPSS